MKTKGFTLHRLRTALRRALAAFNSRRKVLFGFLSRTEHIYSIIAAIIIGVLGAFGAIGFRYLIKYSHLLFFQNDDYRLTAQHQFEWWHVLLLPTIGGLLVGLIVQYAAKEVKGSGIPEVMEAVAIKGGIIRLRVLIAKAFAAAITIGSGGSAGREGPIVHIGAAIGSGIGQFMGISPRHVRTFVACGAAAGIAATFNAPIAGALFAVEVIIGDFAVPKFSPIVISSVTATVLSRYFIGDFPAFEVPPYNLVSYTEFGSYALLGVLAGLIGILFIVTMDKSQDYFEGLKIPAYLKPAMGGFIVGCIAIFFPQVLGVGYESMNQALWGEDVTYILAALLFLKIAATASTLGSGGSGGIFAPSLFIGAMLGALIGTQAGVLFPGSTAPPGAYALVGMGAVVSATTHAPITAILIVFEMTNDYRIIPAVMLASIISVLLATLIKKESMYTMKLVKRGVNIHEGRDLNILKSIKVGEILDGDYEIIPAAMKFGELKQRMLKSEHEVFLVVNNANELIGTITWKSLREFFYDQEESSFLFIAADLAKTPQIVLKKEDNLDLVMHLFGRSDMDEFPVIESDKSKKLAGSIRRNAVINIYNREIFKKDLTGGAHSIVSSVDKGRAIALTDSVNMMEVEPPSKCIGKSLEQLKIRSKYNIEVILIRNSSDSGEGIKGRPGALATPHYVIKPGDRLLIIGESKDINRFRNGE